jgi:large subunit ribosomal protein L31e
MSEQGNKRTEPKTHVSSTTEESEEPAETKEETVLEETTEEEQPEEAAEEEGEPGEAPVAPEEAKAVPAEEEMKPAKEKKGEEEEEIVEERFYTVPLGKALIMPANKRAPRAMRMLKAFIVRNMKLGITKEAEEEEAEEPGRLIVSNEVNLRIWNRGIGKPPRKIRVRAAKDKEGNVTVYLAEGD